MSADVFPTHPFGGETFRAPRGVADGVYVLLELAGVGPNADPIRLGVFPDMDAAEIARARYRGSFATGIRRCAVGWVARGWRAEDLDTG